MTVRRAKAAAVFLCAALFMAAFPGSSPAQAQEGMEYDYVDVGLILEVVDATAQSPNFNLRVIVVNNGSRAAYDVEVVVDVEYPTTESGFIEGGLSEAPLGSASPDGRSLRWTIPALGGCNVKNSLQKYAMKSFLVLMLSIIPYTRMSSSER